MAFHRQTLVVSDVDGTLLDDTGHFPGGRRVFAELIRSVALVLASSRTLAELVELQKSIEHRGALLAENGALLAYHDGWLGLKEGELQLIGGRRLRVLPLGAPVDEVAPLVAECARLARVSLRPLPEIVTALDLPDGEHDEALRRTHSVLLEVMGSLPAVLAFRDALIERGCSMARTGRFTVVVRGSDKGIAVHALIALLRRRWRTLPPIVGVGNAESDATLLAACDRRFVVRDEHGVPDPTLSSVPEVVILDRPGIDGWLEMLERLDITHSVRAP